jgi:protocatechuate 3,4-dioxygenase beta subunit
MRDVGPDSIGAAFMAACGPETTPRLRELLEALTRGLHAFARETRLTHAEWRDGLAFLTRCGAITDDRRNEFVLLSDVLGLSSLVDMISSPADATPSSVLGPFHQKGAPSLPHGGDLKGDHPGLWLVVEGRLRGRGGAPLPGARVEIWQTAAHGLYSNQDPALERDDFRATLTTGSDGGFLFTTVRPAPYTVPTDGPVGDLLRATGRQAWRPAHLHVIAEAAGHRPLVTEIFPADDPYLDADAVFGVRGELVAEFRQETDLSSLPAGLAVRERITSPYQRVSIELALAAAE